MADAPRAAVPDPDPHPVATRPMEAPSLLRALGRWDLLALVINGILGAGIFGLPATVHALLGVYGLGAILVCAAIVALLVLCFAEVSSRFTQTGGPFVYAGAAFGPLLGFLTGWVLWIARVTGSCAICALLLQYLAYISPAMNQGAGRIATAALIVGGLTVIHVYGIRRAASFGNLVTVAKLAPLLLFVGIGLWHIDWSRLQHPAPPLNSNFAEAVLLLAFAFVGWENVAVAAGEMRDPQHDLPRAMITGLAVVAILYGLIQLVCIGTLPELATSQRPLVDAASHFLGPAGALLITLGAAVSMLGNLNGAMITISRLPYAMAAAGQLPRALAVIHPRFRTPHVALIFSGLLMLGLTLSGQFIYLLTVSTIARLLVFGVTCVALPVLRRNPNVAAARFVLPGGFAIPAAAIALIAWLLASSSFTATRDVAILTVIGALLYAIGRRLKRKAAM
jgi:APA family basic amino acid/polyamine antiporter